MKSRDISDTMSMRTLTFLAALPSLAVGLALPSLPRRSLTSRLTSRVSLRAGQPMANAAAVDELLRLLREEDKDKAKIISLSESLASAKPTLADPSLIGNYEVAYFTNSLDGNRDGRDDPEPGSTAAAGTDSLREQARPFGLRRKFLRSLFSLRGSFQHIVSESELVNFVCFKFFGCLEGRVVARGEYVQLPAEEVRAIAQSNGTALTDQTVRITFLPPRVAIAGLTFEITGGGAQPPVL